MKSDNLNKVIFDKLKNCLLNSSINYSQTIYSNFNSSLSRNILLHHPLELEDYNYLEMGLGLKAQNKIEKHQEIMTIPILSGLNGLEMLDVKNDQNLKILKNLINNISSNYSQNSNSDKNKHDELKYQKMLQTQSLIWQVIVNYSNNESYNFDLVNSFPKDDLTQLIYYSKDLIDQMSSSSLKLLFSETLSAYKYIYDLINFEGIFEVSEDIFLWAYNNTLSRKISIIDYYNNEKGNPIELIAPILEYVNHSSIKTNIIAEPDYDIETNNSLIRVYCSRDIESGQQLFLDYGYNENFNNRQFLNRFGFIDLENSNKEIELPFLFDEIFQILDLNNEKVFVTYKELKATNNEFKSNLLKKAKVEDFENKFFKLTLYENKFNIELLKFLRIIFLSLEDFSNSDKKEKCLRHDFSEKYSNENEKIVLEFCLKILEKYFSTLKNNDYNNLISNIGMIDSTEKFKLKNMFLLENEEKYLLDKNLNYLNKKYNNCI